ncbi:hypothetical protein L6452_32566 [Arctium lappa]|uniref:Uncharacterized protein n=1 Tax=Arctium lappa TaxID=4217 RepID=A0ACB8Z422_ARCLA|nr:hypothetical protein L6452_32566 [Arctium lappa]
MDLFGPTNLMSISKKSYCLLIVDDFCRFTWVYFLRTKDETNGLIKFFILRVENQTNQRVKIIRSDNGTEFKNNDLNSLCEEKGIERQYSALRTPQHNGVAERRNRTLIEAARSLLADSQLPVTFWAEAVNTACPDWLFDIDSLTNSLGFSYENNVGTGVESVQDKRQEFVLFPIPTADSTELCVQDKKDASDTKDTETA